MRMELVEDVGDVVKEIHSWVFLECFDEKQRIRIGYFGRCSFTHGSLWKPRKVRSVIMQVILTNQRSTEASLSNGTFLSLSRMTKNLQKKGNRAKSACRAFFSFHLVMKHRRTSAGLSPQRNGPPWDWIELASTLRASLRFLLPDLSKTFAIAHRPSEPPM